MTGCGGVAFSPAFRRILRSSEIPTRSQHPTCPSGIGTSVVTDAIFTGGGADGGWIKPSDVLLSGCGGFTLARGELVRNPRRMMATV
jgi:hypothetical protein